MASLYDIVNYCDSVSYAAISVWSTGATIAAGAIRRQTAPSVGNERVFVCIVAGTTHATTEPTWVLTRGAKTTDNTVTWQEATGIAGMCGDLTNTLTWSQAKALTTPTLGAVIQRNNGASLQICTTAGTMTTSEPAFSDTAGVTTADGTSVWTSLGAVGNWTAFKTAHGRLQTSAANTWFPTTSAHPTGNGITYVGDDHAETSTTALIIAWGTANVALGVAKILCVDHTKVPPYASGDLKTTATITTTGANSITFGASNVSLYCYGLTLSAGSGAVNNTITINNSQANTFLDSCVLKAPGTTGNGAKIVIGNGPARIVFNNVSLLLGATNDGVTVGGGEFIWKNSKALFAGSQIPSAFMGVDSNVHYANIIMEGCDLSDLTGTLNSQSASVNQHNAWIVKDCKLNSSLKVLLPADPDFQLQFVGCDSGANTYKSSRYAYEGVEDTDITHTRTGGAVDPTGQVQSRRYRPAATMSQWTRPLNCEPFSIYNGKTAASLNVNVYGAWFGGCLPRNDEIWLEVEYFGTASFPQGVFANTTKSNILAASAAVTTDSSTWTNSTLVTMDGVPSGAVTVDVTGLIVTHNNTTNGVGCASLAAVDPVNSTAKLYFEAKVTTGFDNAEVVGIANGSISNFTGATIDGGSGAVLGTGSTNVFSNGTTSLGNLGVTALNDVFCIAVDFGNKLFWIRRNNGNWNANASADPATGVGGVTLGTYGFFAPACRFTNAGATDAFTFNFGASAYAQTKPSGFSDWGAAFQAFTFQVQLDTTHNPQPQFAGLISVRPRCCNRQATTDVLAINVQPTGGAAVAGSVGPTFYIDPKIVLT